MGYTPNYAPGDVLTAAAMNSIGAEWDDITYVAGTSWTAPTTNPVIGNGTWAAEYCQINKLVIARYRLTMGSTTTYGTGAWRFALPVTASSSNSAGDVIGFGRVTDIGALLGYPGPVLYISTTTCEPRFMTDSIVGITDGTARDAFTYENGDVVQFIITYEAA